MKKIPKKVILQRYFEEVRDTGTGVPRDHQGDGIPGVVGRHYIFKAKDTGDEIEVKCLRDTPYYYQLIK